MHMMNAKRVIDLLRQPGARLALMHSDRPTKRGFFILPGGVPIGEATARAILARPDVRPHDKGLLPDCPQTWRLTK
jgi:hypothetical protein